MSSTNELVKTFEGAKNNVGVITPDALHNQLNMLTADDWRHASQIYTKQRSGPDGFYIDDSASGSVTVHNDMRQASVYANETAGQATVTQLKKDAGEMGTMAGVITGGATGLFAAGAGLAGADLVIVGAAAGAGAVMALAATAMAGVIIAGGDYATNVTNKTQAEAALKNYRTLTVNSNL